MTLSCGQARDRFDSYTADGLEAEERLAVREHLRTCAGCREAAGSADPLLVFAAPAPLVSPGEGERVLAAVRTGIALRQAQRRLEAPAGRRRAGALAAAAAALTLTLTLTLLAPGRPVPRTPSPSSAAGERGAVTSSIVPAANAAPTSDVIQKTGGTGTYPADATIYEMNPGAGQPRVVWIVDRSIDI